MKFYITTPIYYVNDKPHVGHAYTTIAADVLARYHRMLGHDVFFVTGTDENSQKNVEAAKKAGEADLTKYLDQMSATWQSTWDSLGITNNAFIRTTEERHVKAVEKFWKASFENGDIYEGQYEGLYCVGCESYKTEDDLVDGKCPLHKREPDRLSEKNYFFRLTKYREALLKLIDEHPEFVQPTSRRNEIRSYIDKFMTDVSISRETVKCGIPVPGDDSQRIYVWFDALINYLTAVGYGSDEAMFAKYWPADVHLVGKDIIKFHCALWPAMLLSAGLPLPTRVFANGFFTINGDKISKSLGNAIDPIELAQNFGNDVLRYFLLREIKYGEDGDFALARMEQRYDSDLASELGNLLSRVITMAEKFCDGKVPERADGFLAGAWPAYQLAMEEVRFLDALEVTWKLVRESNQFIDQQAPWKLAKLGEQKMIDQTMYVLLETLRHIAWMLLPFMPETAEKMLAQLGLETPKEFTQSAESAWVWGGLEPGHVLQKSDPLFPRRP